MKRLITILPAFCLCTCLMGQVPVDLKCEYLDSPIGIDEDVPRMTWKIKDARSGEYQSAYRIVVGVDSSKVASGYGDVWDSGKVASGDILTIYKGKPLASFTQYWWRVEYWDREDVPHISRNARFETAMMHPGEWKGNWISDGQDVSGNGMEERRAPLFRKEFEISGKVKSARAYICAAGLYEMTLNGMKVGDKRLDPMFTRYDRRNYYSSFDVTGQVNEGKNAIGIILGNGWYNHQPKAVWFFDRAPWRNRPAFCMDLRIEYEDGSLETISTNTKWKTTLGPVTVNNIYTAEQYDARLELPGWNLPGYDDSGWNKSIYRSAPSRNIVSQALHPIRDVDTLLVKSIKKLNDSTYICDFGRNITGVTEFSIEGEEGMTFYLKHGEVIVDGKVNISNIKEYYRPTDDSEPFATDIYTLSGRGKETFRPLFNYKGFQYVEVSCNKAFDLSKDNLKAYFMHTDFPCLGRVETSNELINKLWWASNNSYLSNFFGYPTDCPHREKNGWTGDAGVATDLGLYNFDGITLYEKWMADHRDEQQPNGVLPCIIPTSGWGYHWANGIDWTSTIAIIPWAVYQFYGDSRLLERCYDNIKLLVDHFSEIYPDGLTRCGLGDWIPVKSVTPVELTSSIYFYNAARILTQAARLFGNEDDAVKYDALSRKIQNAVNSKYLNTETGQYWKGTQTAQSVALMWGIVPEEYKAKVACALKERVEADGNHIDVGLLGTKALLMALSENGYSDLAFLLASRDDFPSWGNWISHGATTFYEEWPAEWEVRPTMSLNHVMFGEINAWFYKALGGINPDPEHPGFKNIILKPKFVKGLDRVSVEHESPYGTIISEWTRKGKTIIYDITIPANSTASLILQNNVILKDIKCSGKKIQIHKANEEYSLYSGHFTIFCQEL